MRFTAITQQELLANYRLVRGQTQRLCDPLEVEDFVVQPVVDVSPLKWHLGHTTWFFENFVLVPNVANYQVFHEKYALIFNSYYISAGDRWSRESRGQLTRPTVREIFNYRAYVNDYMQSFLQQEDVSEEVRKVVMLGLNHEQQHQELFLYDIKRILGDNPLYPLYREKKAYSAHRRNEKEWLQVDEGVYTVGFQGEGFHFDNEEGSHRSFLHEFQIASNLVTNSEYQEFMDEGGYTSFQYWLSEGWDWVNNNKITAPRYWVKEQETWWHYTLHGFEPVQEVDPLCHISYYEADAFARWKGCRLPTEQEWEVACGRFSPDLTKNSNFVENDFFRPVQNGAHNFLGNVWEWTASPYTAYPYYDPPEGALGEYNGKFMVNQLVLRGGSFGTPRSHIRTTYRNFFHPHLRWMFSGIRLARHI